MEEYQHRFGDQRCRLCGTWPVRGQPRRNPATDHEPGRRLGQVWRHSKLPGARLVSHRANDALYQNKEWVDYISDRIPVKRPGEVRDLDAAVVFLASEGSRYVTGQTLLVDGGISTGATRALTQTAASKGN